jgi:glycosyltransferase involved in cell wall biosynthesis
MKLSVVIPMYNARAYIEEAVRSISHKSLYFVDEIIIYNDGSTDNPADVIEKIKFKYKRIKYFTSQVNKGGAYARNFSIGKTKNKLIYVLDADNIVHINSFIKLYKYALKKKFIAHMDEHKFFSIKKEKIDTVLKYSGFYQKELTYKKLLKKLVFSDNFIFAKKHWIKAGKYSTRTHWDTQTYSCDFLKKVGPIPICKNTFFYRRRFDPKNTSYYMRQEKSGENFFNAFKLFEIILEDLNINKLFFLLKNDIFLFSNVITILENYRYKSNQNHLYKLKKLQFLIKILIFHKNKKYRETKSMLKDYIKKNKSLTDLILFIIIRSDRNYKNKEYSEFKKVKNFLNFLKIYKEYPNSKKLILYYIKFLTIIILKKIKNFLLNIL